MKTDSNKSNEGNVDGDHQCNHSLRRLTKLIPSLSVLLKDQNNESTLFKLFQKCTHSKNRSFFGISIKKTTQHVRTIMLEPFRSHSIPFPKGLTCKSHKRTRQWTGEAWVSHPAIRSATPRVMSFAPVSCWGFLRNHPTSVRNE